jgi:hypothetical protein
VVGDCDGIDGVCNANSVGGVGNFDCGVGIAICGLDSGNAIDGCPARISGFIEDIGGIDCITGGDGGGGDGGVGDGGGGGGGSLQM